jgi:hypothetical protein
MKKIIQLLVLIYLTGVLSVFGQSKIADLKDKIKINLRDINIEKNKIKGNETQMQSISYKWDIVELKKSNVEQDIIRAREFVFLRTSEEKAEQILNLKEKLSILNIEGTKLYDLYHRIQQENKERLSNIRSMEKLNAEYSKKLAELEKNWQAKYFDW